MGRDVTVELIHALRIPARLALTEKGRRQWDGVTPLRKTIKKWTRNKEFVHSALAFPTEHFIGDKDEGYIICGLVDKYLLANYLVDNHVLYVIKRRMLFNLRGTHVYEEDYADADLGEHVWQAGEDKFVERVGASVDSVVWKRVTIVHVTDSY